MPLGDIAGEVLGGIFRLLGELFMQIVVELLVKGPGSLICRLFRRDANPDGGLVVFVGLLFWAVVAGAIYAACSYFGSAGA
jgi:hypothetical protein